MDLEPHVARDPATSRQLSVRALRSAVRRDIEWLLNTRSVAFPPPEELPEVRNSVYAYGLTDLSSFSGDDPEDRNRLLRSIEKTLAIFEPRLGSVKVSEMAVQAGKDMRQIRFVIQASLKLDPAPEQIVFDTVLDLASGQYGVRGDGGA